MRSKNRRFTHKVAGLLAAVVVALVLPATAEAGDVTVTASPTSLPAPGGNIRFTVSISKYPLSMTYPVQDAWVQSLSDSVYGDVSRLGGDCAVPAPLPYSCTFFGDFIGQAGETQTNTLTATQTTGPTGPDYFPQPPYTRSGSATVSLTGLSVLAAVKKSCKKGLRPKMVRTKHGKKQKCVRKKSRP